MEIVFFFKKMPATQQPRGTAYSLDLIDRIREKYNKLAENFPLKQLCKKIAEEFNVSGNTV